MERRNSREEKYDLRFSLVP